MGRWLTGWRPSVFLVGVLSRGGPGSAVGDGLVSHGFARSSAQIGAPGADEEEIEEKGDVVSLLVAVESNI